MKLLQCILKFFRLLLEKAGCEHCSCKAPSCFLLCIVSPAIIISIYQLEDQQILNIRNMMIEAADFSQAKGSSDPLDGLLQS